MILVIPENHALPSGGNVFNRLFVKALRKTGTTVEALTPAPALSRMRKAEAGTWWVDSLCFGDLDRFLALQGKKRKVYALVHSLPSLDPDLSPAERRNEMGTEWRQLNRVSGFLVTSSWTRALLRRRRFTQRPIIVVPPAPAVRPGRRRKVAGRGFSGLIIGNLIRRKGVLEFLDCLDRRLKPSDRFSLRIAGRSDIEPDYARNCLELIARNEQLNRSVTYLGPLSLSRMKRLYESSTVFITASAVETFGMALQEARLFGLPVLALDAVYARRRLGHDGTGILVPTVPDLVEACLEFIRHPAALEDLVQRGRTTAPALTYDWEDAARLFLRQLTR
jgi:glycosyltransferase involved in cell wall biosynthesis